MDGGVIGVEIIGQFEITLGILPVATPNILAGQFNAPFQGSIRVDLGLFATHRLGHAAR